MDSPSSTDKFWRGFSDSEQLEDYDELEWHDKDCTAPFANQNHPLTSKICNACQSLFSGLKKTQKQHKHYYHSSALCLTADKGCQLCALVRSQIESETNHRPPEILRLEFIFHQGIRRSNVTEFELWFRYLRIPVNTKFAIVVWGIEIIDFLFSERKWTPYPRRLQFLSQTTTSDVLGVLQMLVKQPLVAMSSRQVPILPKIDSLQENGSPIAPSIMKPAITPRPGKTGNQHVYSK